MIQSWYRPLIESMEMQAKYIMELEMQLRQANDLIATLTKKKEKKNETP